MKGGERTCYRRAKKDKGTNYLKEEAHSTHILSHTQDTKKEREKEKRKEKEEKKKLNERDPLKFKLLWITFSYSYPYFYSLVCNLSIE